MASCPPRRRRIWSPVPVDVRPEVLREACLARVVVVMQRDHGCYMTLSHRARLCGELGEGWAEELLSLRPQMFESLSEE
jgi:hypothetical protein